MESIVCLLYEIIAAATGLKYQKPGARLLTLVLLGILIMILLVSMMALLTGKSA